MRQMRSWEKCCIDKEMSIREAMEVIEAASVQFAMVRENRKLLGVVTDGDVRRGILRGIPLTAPVRTVLNPRPVVARVEQDKNAVARIMRQKRLHHIPVLNEEDEVVNLYTIEELSYKKSRDNIVVLMAGGLGTRLRPLTDSTPKPLLKVGNKPILATIIENFREDGFYKFYLSVNYKSEMIEKYFGGGESMGVEISYIHEKERLGTAGALYYLPRGTNEPIVVMNGDLLTKADFGDFVDFHRREGAVATMGVREYTRQIPYGVIDFDGERIVSIREKPSETYLINAGMYVLSPEVLDLLREEKAVDMPNLFTDIIAGGGKTTVYPIREYWLDIGRIDDFERAQRDYAEFFLK